jgi:antitoxin component HigA of HigAB toxin-antitoxin module
MTHGSGRADTTPTYAELLVRYQPATITSVVEAEAVQRQIDSLVDQETLSEAERRYLSLLGDLIIAWEAGKYDLPDISGREAVRELLLVHGLRQVDLVGAVFPTRSVASAVLSGKRPLSYETVRKLTAYFSVPADVFYPVSDREQVLA